MKGQTGWRDKETKGGGGGRETQRDGGMEEWMSERRDRRKVGGMDVRSE